MATRSKPVVLIIVGVVLVGSALILVLMSIGLALGDVIVIDNTPPTWVLLGGAAIGLTAAYLALRIGFGLFANPARNRKATEKALWLGIPVVWMAMVGVNLLLTGGQDDVAATHRNVRRALERHRDRGRPLHEVTTSASLLR